MPKLRIPIMIKIKIVIGVLVAVLVLLGLDFYFTGALVAKKYLVASSSSPRLNRSAFVYNYTLRTGDDTLALLTGTDMSVTPIGGMQLTGYTENDLRPLAKNVCRAWIEQGRINDTFTKTEQDAAKAIIDSGIMEGSEVSYTHGGLYTTDSSLKQMYSIQTNTGEKQVTSLRCCCCFSETMAQLLLGRGFDSKLDYYHTKGMGLAIAPRKVGKDYYMPNSGDKVVQVDGKYIQYPLNTKWNSALNEPTVESLVNDGSIKVGSILLFALDEARTQSKHVEFVTYIDKEKKIIYMCGAGGGESIVEGALWGYSRKFSYGSGEKVDEIVMRSWNEEKNAYVQDGWLANIIHYTESYMVTGGAE